MKLDKIGPNPPRRPPGRGQRAPFRAQPRRFQPFNCIVRVETRHLEGVDRRRCLSWHDGFLCLRCEFWQRHVLGGLRMCRNDARSGGRDREAPPARLQAKPRSFDSFFSPVPLTCPYSHHALSCEQSRLRFTDCVTIFWSTTPYYIFGARRRITCSRSQAKSRRNQTPEGTREALIFSGFVLHYSPHLISRFVTRRNQGTREALISGFVHYSTPPLISRFVQRAEKQKSKDARVSKAHVGRGPR